MPDSSPRPSGQTSTRFRIQRTLLTMRRAVLRRRRLLAAVLAGVAVLTGLRATAAPPPPTVPVLTARADLPSGTVLGPEHLRVARYADGTAPPDGTVTSADAVGRTLAAPLRAGEPVTDVRLVGRSMLAGYPGLEAIPVRLPDPEVVELLRVGDRIDVRGVDPRGGETSVTLARGVPVLAIPRQKGDSGANTAFSANGAGLGGRLVVLGVPPGEADTLARASAQVYLSIGFSR